MSVRTTSGAFEKNVAAKRRRGRWLGLFLCPKPPPAHAGLYDNGLESARHMGMAAGPVCKQRPGRSEERAGRGKTGKTRRISGFAETEELPA